MIHDNVFEAATEHMILMVGIAYRNTIQSNRLNPNIRPDTNYDIIRFQQIFGGDSGQYNLIANNFCQPSLDFEPYVITGEDTVVSGYDLIYFQTSLPTATADNRGQIKHIEGDGDDIAYICKKKENNMYAWVEIL
jgi:hypothetical protein